MIHMVFVNWIRTKMPQSVANDLGEIVASLGESPRQRGVWLPLGHQALERILVLLRSAGLTEQQGEGARGESEYSASHSRLWEKADLDTAEYLWLRVGARSGDKARILVYVESEESQALWAQDDELPRGNVGLVGSGPGVFCADGTKRRLETVGFRHLRFGSLRIKRRGSGQEPFEDLPGHEPWWQLRSDYELPPMSSAVERWRAQGSQSPMPAPRAEQGPVFLREPPFRDVQPRYLASEWQARDSIDAAASYERTGSGEFDRMLMVSRRVYEFCEREGIRADWVPVRIDPQ